MIQFSYLYAFRRFAYSNVIPLDGVQILWGIYTDIKNDKMLTETDDTQIHKLIINETTKRSESCTLSIKVRVDKFQSFFGFVRDHYGKSVVLRTEGITPFVSDSASEDVYIMGYSSPVRAQEKYYTMEMSLRKV